MTKADAAQLIGIIVMAYPNYDKFRDEKAVRATVDLWAMMFKDDAAGIVGLATKKHIATSKWPPSVAEIRELMVEIEHPDLIPPDQAWTTVTEYMRVCGEYGNGGRGVKLPPMIEETVKSIGYHNLYEMNCGTWRGSKPGIARVAFMDVYTPAYERAKRSAMTPQEVNGQIEEAASRVAGQSRAMIDGIHREAVAQENFYASLEPHGIETKRRAIAGG